MIYTTNFQRVKKAPQDSLKIVITRFPPKWFDEDDYDNMKVCKHLGPKPETLSDYKEDKDWDKYTLKYLKQIQQDSKAKNTLLKIAKLLLQGKDVYLVCFEKNEDNCHRNILASILSKVCNVKHKQF